MRKGLILFLSTLVLAGCSSNFKYQRKPGASHEGPALPVTVAVVAFEDGTEAFTSRGNFFSGSDFNLARTGINGRSISSGAAFSLSPLPAELWSKSLVEDMSASGAFRSVKFMYASPERTGEDVFIEGVLTKAYLTTIKNKPDEFILHLKARRTTDNTVVLESDIGKIGVRASDLTSGCQWGGCNIDRFNAYLNGVMQDIFARIERDLVRALTLPPAERKPLPPGEESPEDVVRRILGDG